MDLQTIYQQTIKYAAAKHLEVKQRLPGTKKLPYVIHLNDVAMEILIASQYPENFNTKLAIQAALASRCSRRYCGMPVKVQWHSCFKTNSQPLACHSNGSRK